MGAENQNTAFAPATRSPGTELEEQVKIFARMEGLIHIVKLIPDVVLILNRNRQIVFANNTAFTLLQQDNPESVYGLRPGELLDCSHAFDSAGGCGTTQFCSACGAVKAVLSGLRGKEAVDECRVIQKKTGNALDLRIWAFPLEYDKQKFSLFVVNDISNEKRRRILERIFFHDILNTASGIFSFSEILQVATATELEEFKGTILKLSSRLIDEINSQRELLAAESNELTVHPVSLKSLELLKSVSELYRTHEVAKGKRLVIDSRSQEMDIMTDKGLLSRVIGNMTKNALEASEVGQTVTLGCEAIDGDIQFWIHNPTVIPQKVQLQIFQRSFSTRSAGRGLGTYSMRLLSERYLQGRVSFTSCEKEGTRFTVRYPVTLQVK